MWARGDRWKSQSFVAHSGHLCFIVLRRSPTYIYLKRIMAYMGVCRYVCVEYVWTGLQAWVQRLRPFLMRFSSIFAIHLAAANKARGNAQPTSNKCPNNFLLNFSAFFLYFSFTYVRCYVRWKILNLKAFHFRLGGRAN